MTAHVYSATNIGFEGKLIEVECDASNGLPGLVLVGLTNKAVDEAKERVRSAIKNSGLEFPKKRITINLAPANLPKDGAHFDLAIAVALLCVSGQIAKDELETVLMVGELGLDGSLRPVRGIIGHVETAKRAGMKRIIIPLANYAQAALITGVSLVPARSLAEATAYLSHTDFLPPAHASNYSFFRRETVAPTITLDDIHGQEQAKRALLIAAAGHHNVLFDGPPGAGKTMLAKALLSLLPALSKDELIEVTKLHSIAGESDEEIIHKRPFRSPHHGASQTSLVGGGIHPKPGEISLAHRGVLFLDELPEYTRSTLEALRQPLEDNVIHIARTHGRVSYPANFMLIATQNPCPCGYATDQTHACSCSALQIQRYRKKVSGPLLDRIDLHVEVSRVEPRSLLQQSAGTTDYVSLIARALDRQKVRFASSSLRNADLTNEAIKQLCQLDHTSEALLNSAANKLHLSARSYFKVIKVARTIADLEQQDSISVAHISEALQYRQRTSIT